MGRSAGPWCKYYRGMSERDSCEAGVQFKSLPNFGTKEFYPSCPCFGPLGGCDKAEYPTAEELAAQKAEDEKRFQAIGKARAAIVESLGGPWKRGMPGSSGAIDCPVCGGEGTLEFSRAGYNGHIHAGCSTADCVWWME